MPTVREVIAPVWLRDLECLKLLVVRDKHGGDNRCELAAFALLFLEAAVAFLSFSRVCSYAPLKSFLSVA